MYWQQREVFTTLLLTFTALLSEVYWPTNIAGEMLKQTRNWTVTCSIEGQLDPLNEPINTLNEIFSQPSVDWTGDLVIYTWGSQHVGLTCWTHIDVRVCVYLQSYSLQYCSQSLALCIHYYSRRSDWLVYSKQSFLMEVLCRTTEGCFQWNGLVISSSGDNDYLMKWGYFHCMWGPRPKYVDMILIDHILAESRRVDL